MEGDPVVAAAAQDRVLGEVAERIVHPAHVPLEIEAQAAEFGRRGHALPGGRFLGDRQHPGVLAAHGAGQLLKERLGLIVGLAALFVGNPLPVLAVVVAVQHRADRIDPQAVDVEAPAPVEGGGDQEIADLGAAEVEDQGAPGLVLALTRIAVFEARGAVEAGEREVVLGEMPRDEIDDHPEPGLVALVDEPLEVVGRAMAAVRRVLAGDLVAPRTLERVLGQGQQLDVGEAELTGVADQVLGQDTVVGPSILAAAALPRAEVDLVHRHRLGHQIAAGALDDPRLVVPDIGILRRDDARGRGRDFGLPSERIGFHPQLAGSGANLVLVEHPRTDPGNEQLPDTVGLTRAHRLGRAVEAIPVTNN